MCDFLFTWRSDFDDRLILNVHGQSAAHTTIRTDGIGLRLARLIPFACLAQIVLAAKHQRAGRTYANAVAAVHAGRIR